MKCALLLLLCSLSAFAQDGSKWIRSEWNDKLTGDHVAGYQLFAQPDGSGRKPYIAITCDQTAKRFTYGYFTDENVNVNAQSASLGAAYYPATVQYRTDAAKVKTASVTVRPDFRTINLDQSMLMGLSGSREFAISFPALSGYTVTDVFASSPLPGSYASDCYTENMRRKTK